MDRVINKIFKNSSHRIYNGCHLSYGFGISIWTGMAI